MPNTVSAAKNLKGVDYNVRTRTLYYPILIEYKGYEDKLIKKDANGQIDNKKPNNEPNFSNINAYAVNGAVHYADAILHYTDYTDIFAVGITG